MVWGAISKKSFYMKIIERGTIDSAKYCQIVGAFIPYATAFFPGGWILEQNGVTPHTSRQTKDFFAQNSVPFLQWPPNYPDNNPVENVWTLLKSSVEKKNPKTKDELIQYVQESQHVISLAVRKNLTGSIPTRLAQCLEIEGKFVRELDWDRIVKGKTQQTHLFLNYFVRSMLGQIYFSNGHFFNNGILDHSTQICS